MLSIIMHNHHDGDSLVSIITWCKQVATSMIKQRPLLNRPSCPADNQIGQATELPRGFRAGFISKWILKRARK